MFRPPVRIWKNQGDYHSARLEDCGIECANLFQPTATPVSCNELGTFERGSIWDDTIIGKQGHLLRTASFRASASAQPKRAACSGVPDFAFEPELLTACSIFRVSREKPNMISCPRWANSLPNALPMLPTPIMPIFIPASPQ
jgi:hypothetical protein